MGACSSSPAASESSLPNSSPVHAAVTQVKQKRADSDEAGNGLLDAQLQADDSTPAAADGSTAAQSASSDSDTALGVSGGADKEADKQQEETKEQTVEIRPASASQQKLSARTVAPLPANSASNSPATLTSTDTSAAIAAASATAAASAAAPASTFASPAADDFPTTLPASSSQFSAGDLKYKSTVRDVLVLLLDRFTRTMEYEKAAFQELAIGVGYTNYMQLYDYAAFESFLRVNYVIPPSPSPQQQDTDLRYISQYFSLFLTLAQSGECDTRNRIMPTRQQLTSEMQQLCSNTAEQLRKWCVNQHATAEVKEHLLFFSTALKFAEGDLINQPELLYKNIDDICD